jgi:hypothetical protein
MLSNKIETQAFIGGADECRHDHALQTYIRACVGTKFTGHDNDVKDRAMPRVTNAQR